METRPPQSQSDSDRTERLGSGKASESAGKERGPVSCPEQLGPYRIEKSLARGGMGEVCLGVDPVLNRRVAIKRLSNALLEDSDAVERFKREARATAAVSHPNIAGVYFVGADEDGRPFLAMEYIDGLNLVEVIRQKVRVTYSTLCDWMAQACQGLQAAHRAGIIHRDLKPGNLMIARDGTVKIVDFGLAKIFFDDLHKTQTGTVLGTPQYMSPEQGQGRGIDHRSDIYSLGATFYCLLTGRPPFDGPSLVDVMLKHVTAPLIPIYSINPDVPLPLCDIVHRMMAKDPNDRPQDYEDLIADLKAVKLQMLTRERGAFVGNEALPFPSRQDPDDTLRLTPGKESPSQGTDSDADLKAIVGQTRRELPPVGEEDAATLRSIEFTTSEAPSQATLGNSISPRQWIPIGVGLIILLLGVLGLLLRSGGGRATGKAITPASATTSPDGLSTALARMIRPDATPTPIPVPPELNAARITLTRLDELSRTAQSFELSHQKPLTSLHALIEADLTNEADTLDGWGRPIVFRGLTNELVSCGGDGAEGGEDDFVVKVGDKPTLPEPYRKLQEQFIQQLKEREKP